MSARSVFSVFSVSMSQHPNRNMDLSSATPLLTMTASSPDDCGMKCASASPCKYVTHDAATNACVMYNATVSSLFGTSKSAPNSFKLYAVVAK